MQDLRVVTVGASAGGVPALEAVVAQLPADLPAAVFVVLHIPPDTVSRLPRVLGAKGNLPALHPRDGDAICAGRIYVAQPDHHLLIDGDRIAVKKGPKENRHRPSIDALFRSAAYSYGPRAIGVVLSGALDDGTSGLWSIKRFGGVAIVQDPSDARFDSMPRSAIEQVDIDLVLRAEEIGSRLSRLIRSPPRPSAARPPADLVERTRVEIEVAATANAFRHGVQKFGTPSLLTCPECHGALVKLVDGSIVRYRCHTGHGFTASALLAGVTASTGKALWDVTRSMEEGVMLLDDLVQQLDDAGRSEEAERVGRKARSMEERARTLQMLAVGHEHLSEDLLRSPIDEIEQSADYGTLP